MQLDLPIEVLTLLVEGFDLAGDGGIDPFSREDRAAAEAAIAEHRPLIQQYGERHRDYRPQPGPVERLSK